MSLIYVIVPMIVGFTVPTLAYGLRRAIDHRFDRPREEERRTSPVPLDAAADHLLLGLLREEFRRESRQALVRDLGLNTLFFCLGVGLTLVLHYAWD